VVHGDLQEVVIEMVMDLGGTIRVYMVAMSSMIIINP
jgi:putative component of toxin-antitoxin plasmid stabilization module